MLALALWTAASGVLQHMLLDTWFLFFCTLFTGFLIPLLVLLADALKNRRKKGGG